MQLEVQSRAPVSRQRITSQYKLAVIFYLAPLVWFVLGLIDGLTFDLTGMFFVSTAMLSLIPSGCIGLFFSITGMVMAFKNNDYQKKDIGYANLLMGIIMVITGFIAAGFIYVMVS